jgi:CDP-glycerol glycerophosphotransferase
VPDATAPSRPAGAVPDVTVIVIGYNDAGRLPTAVGSVLDQTLHNRECIIVDDASTDGTGDVARSLAAADPDRVRAVTLPENSGGCSRPRNVGIELARAPYVMFLDSDDTLERHACKNLLLRAEETGADLVSGICVRILAGRRNRRHTWYPNLYAERQVFDSIRDNPDLMFDTLCTNKLYRREFVESAGLRFPEGLHYEDLLFVMEAYCSARRIATLPVEVYRWMVLKDTDEESIHQRRGDLQNFLDRLEIHRRIDRYLTERGHEELRPFKDRKFLRHDLKLYLTELPFRDEDYQRAWLAEAAGYLATFDDESLRISGRLAHAAAFLIRAGDLEGVLAVARLWARGRLSTQLTVRDGRAYLTERHLDTAEGREALDVTSYHLHDAPFSFLNLASELTALSAAGPSLRLAGAVVNQQRRIAEGDPVQVTVSLRHRRSGARFDVPADAVSVDGDVVRWGATVPLATMPKLPGRSSRWRMWTVLTWHGEANLSLPVARPDALPADARWRSGTEVRLSPRRNRSGVVVHGQFSPNDTRLLVESSRAAGPDVRRRRKRRAGWQRRLQSRQTKAAVYRRVLRRLPVRRDTVVFESHMGRAYGDSPKYVYEALQRTGRRHRAVWSYATPTPEGWPDAAVLVRRDSWRYWYELARAGYWVDNQGFPSQVARRPQTRYLQTWHGTALKLMGYDSPLLELGPAADRERFAAGVSRWTDLTVQGPFDEETFARAFRHSARVHRTGLPRNGPLVAAGDPATADVVGTVKRRLEVPADRRIALYAPTFRDYLRMVKQPFELPFKLERMRERLGNEWLLLIRGHYLDDVQVQSRFLTFARDVSDYPDVTELLLASDVLITDYSSIMFDFALTGRPMLFFTPDLETYEIARGTYFDLRSAAPGPVVRTQDEVVDWLQDPESAHAQHAAAYDEFVRRFCSFATADAADAVVREVFGDLR